MEHTTTTTLRLDQLRLDGGTQPRAELNDDTVLSYAERMREGDPFPPIRVVYDGTAYWLWDGFHRVEATRRNGDETIAAVVEQGTLDDAQWASYSANRTNGLQRAQSDCARSVQAAIRHPRSRDLSNRAIATHVGVAEGTVRYWRKKQDESQNGTETHQGSALPNLSADSYRVGRDGKLHPAHRQNGHAASATDADVDDFDPSEPAYTPPTLQQISDLRRAVLIRGGEWHGENRLNGETRTFNVTLPGQRPQPYTAEDLWMTLEAFPVLDLTSDDWFTPADIIERVTDLFGGRIDTDPASNLIAQRVVQASIWYDEQQNGLDQPWYGNVYLNPPYSNPAPWVARLIEEYQAGGITAAVVLVNNQTDSDWCQDLLKVATPCFHDGRIHFWRPDRDGKDGARQGQVLFYLGPDDAGFRDHFGDLGMIMGARDQGSGIGDQRPPCSDGADPQPLIPEPRQHEADLQREIVYELEQIGCRVLRTNAGMIYTEQGAIKLSPAGWPDLTVFIPRQRLGDGRGEAGATLFVEVKRPDGKGKVSDVQRQMHRDLRDAGFAVVVVDNLDTVFAALQDLGVRMAYQTTLM